MSDVIVAHPNTIRGPIEEEYNALRDGIEATYAAAVATAAATRKANLIANENLKKAALVAAGLNADGSTPLTYPETADPENTVAPTITGTEQVGQLLTGHNGTWTFSPSFTYQWERADDISGTNLVEIPSATAITYTPVAGDQGKHLRVVVTGTNPSGQHTAESAYTGDIAAA